MTATSEAPSPTSDVKLENLPTEILFILFEYVSPKDMLRCRQVCVRWKDVIDVTLHNDYVWERFCKHDFRKVYKQAMCKTPNITDWYGMYRSLSLWSQLHRAKETIEEFCHIESMHEEMKNAVVQKHGMIMIHKRTRVVYHDLMTLEVAKRKGSAGQFASFVELKDVVVMRGLDSKLHIINKPNHNWYSDLIVNTDEDDKIVFHNVQAFNIEDRTIIYKTQHSNLFMFHLDNNKVAHRIDIPEQMLEGTPNGLAALGYTDGCLYILTMSQNMYSYVNKQVSLKFTLSTVTNLMDCLYKHNMLENMNWRLYYMLLLVLKHKPHTGLLQFISKMQIYGDHLFFVGTTNASICLYYKPIKNGKLELEEFTPIKKYSFSGRIDRPILSMYPIMNIDVAETKDGHMVFLCMPHKIIVIKYVYEFKRPVSKAIINKQ